MNKQSNSRRDFMRLATASAAGSLVTWNAESYARIAGSNDRAGIGVVGFSERFQDALTIEALHSGKRVAFDESRQSLVFS
ncbi:MAG: twin-arginine translocation signal domain-containing protein [Blastocatellia bacterium]